MLGLRSDPLKKWMPAFIAFFNREDAPRARRIAASSGEAQSAMKSSSIYKEGLFPNGTTDVPKGNNLSVDELRASWAKILARKDLRGGAKTLLLAMDCIAEPDGRVQASDDFLASAAGMSRSKIGIVREKLESAGLIEKDGAPRNRVFPYRLLHRQFEKPKMKFGPPLQQAVPCRRCNRRDLPIKFDGFCPGCVDLNTAEREVGEVLTREPDIKKRDIYSELKISGSKSSAKLIRLAYNAINAARMA